ncbi:MAG TPA: hypothetical protein VJR70_10505 [Stellaceae bacterium]|nr:hypothetical protein [Stellaceae bacterium]
MAPVKNADCFPPLNLPNPRTADPGKVRLGDSAITGKFPPLQKPNPRTADPGKVRLGDSAISGSFPLHR